MWWTRIGDREAFWNAVMYPDNKMSMGSNVEYILCTDCGFIIESYVKKPGKFKGTLY